MTETPSPEPQPDAGWFDPTGRAYRFTILFFAGFMIYGSYFAYDAIGAIVDALMADLGVGQREIGTLYTLYSLGPMLFLFAAGMLIDRVGTRKASLIFSGAITLGAILVAIPNLWVMYAGRIIFGFGSEALIVAQSAILARWFKGKELALAFGVALTISRLGTLFSFNTEALVAERLGPFAALWVAAALCGASMLSNLAYVIMDRRAQATLQLKDEEAGEAGGSFHCFSGNGKMADFAVRLGFRISFSGALTFRNAEPLRQVAARIPLDRLLTETDAPFLAPHPFRGKRNEPLRVRAVVKCMAEIHELTEEEMGRKTTENFETLFSLPAPTA